MKKNTFEGAVRAYDPAKTLKNVEPLLKKYGITRSANITGLDSLDIPVVTVCRPNSRSIAISQGKGITYEFANASAIMESIETYHAERIDHPILFGTQRSISQEFVFLSAEELRPFQMISIDESTLIRWIKGHDFVAKVDTYVPYELVHTNYTLPRKKGDGNFIASSNGLASGNNILEARIHAICEVIERDHCTIWELVDGWQKSSTRIDPNSITDPIIRGLLDKVREGGAVVSLWSATQDLGVPVCMCWIADSTKSKNKVGHRVSIGSGCHLRKEIALSRAITEAAQDRLTLISGQRDDLVTEDYEQPDAEIQDMRSKIFMEFEANLPFADIPSVIHDTFEEDFNFLIDKLTAAGIEKVVNIDIADEGLPYSVVRIVIPGLELPIDEESYTVGPRGQSFIDKEAP